MFMHCHILDIFDYICTQIKAYIMDILNKSIDAKEYTLKEILNDKKYTCDYFQREYKWKKENVEQLYQRLGNQVKGLTNAIEQHLGADCEDGRFCPGL